MLKEKPPPWIFFPLLFTKYLSSLFCRMTHGRSNQSGINQVRSVSTRTFIPGTFGRKKWKQNTATPTRRKRRRRQCSVAGDWKWGIRELLLLFQFAGGGGGGGGGEGGMNGVCFVWINGGIWRRRLSRFPDWLLRKAPMKGRPSTEQ